MGSIDGKVETSWKGKSRRSRSHGFGPRLGEGIRASQPSCGLGLSDARQLPKENIAGAVRLFRAPEEGAVRRMRGGAAPDHHGHPARVLVELLAFTRIVLQEALSEVTKIYPSLKLRVFVDDTTALVKGRNKDGKKR